MLLEILGIAWLVFGLFFCAVGVLGVLRMPDLYTRLHASGKVAALGLFGLLVGAVFLMPSTILKVIALGLFILITSPVTTHAIAASEYRRKEIVEELMEIQHPGENIDMSAIRVTGYLSRVDVKDIIEAHTRTLRTEDDDDANDR